MPVTPGARPTEVNFVDSDTDMASGHLGTAMSAGTAYPDPNNTANNVRDLKIFGKIPTLSKGGIWTFDGTDLVALPVGLDGYVLTADSSQPDGVKWAAASGGGSSLLGMISPSTLAVPSASSMTWLNQINGTAGNNSGGALLMSNRNVASANGNSFLIKAVPASTPYTVLAGIIQLGRPDQAATTFILTLYDSVTSNLVGLEFYTYNNSVNFKVNKWVSPTGASTQLFSESNSYMQPSWLRWFSIYNDGTNLTFSILPDGQSRWDLYSTTISSVFSNTPSHWGLGFETARYQDNLFIHADAA